MNIFRKKTDTQKLDKIQDKKLATHQQYYRRLDKYNKERKPTMLNPDNDELKPAISPKIAAKKRDRKLSRLSWKQEKVEKGY